MIGWLINVEQLVEWDLARGIKVLREDMNKRQFSHCNWDTTWPGVEAGPTRWEGGY
jgi:hypothetical protein